MVPRTYAVMSNDVLIAIPLFVSGLPVERAGCSIGCPKPALALARARMLAFATVGPCYLRHATGIVGAGHAHGLLAFRDAEGGLNIQSRPAPAPRAAARDLIPLPSSDRLRRNRRGRLFNSTPRFFPADAAALGRLSHRACEAHPALIRRCPERAAGCAATVPRCVRRAGASIAGSPRARRRPGCAGAHGGGRSLSPVAAPLPRGLSHHVPCEHRAVLVRARRTSRWAGLAGAPSSRAGSEEDP